MSTSKRLTKELAEITKTPPPGMKVSLVDEADLFHWNVIMEGPEGSPYANGKFSLSLTLPTDYPFKPPTLSFRTKIFHPNVTNDDKGSMCLGILKPDAWKPSSKITAVLQAAQSLLVEPNPDDAVEESSAKLYREDRKEWEKQAKEWTKKYAK